MVIIIEVIFRSIHALGFIFDKGHTSADYLIISILIKLSGFFADLLDALDESIVITVGIVGDDTHAAVDFDDLFPVRKLSRTIVFDSFELIRISVSPL